MSIEPRSPTRRQLADWARLTQKKYRRERGEFLIEGEVCVREALASRVGVEAVLVLAETAEEWPARLPALSRVPVYAVTTDHFARISKVESSQGIVGMGRVFHLPPRPGDFAIACEQVSDPGNCGALIRVADFFGAIELLLGPDSADVWNAKVVRGSMGSLFHQPVAEGVELERVLRDWPGSSVATVARGGHSLRAKLDLKPPVLLVLGHETRGLSPELAELCTHRVTLERKGDAESLNLVTAAAVFSYALSNA